MGKPLLLFLLSLLLFVCLFARARVILPEHYDDSVANGNHGLPVAEKTVETDAELLLLPSQKQPTDVPNLPGTSVPESSQMDHPHHHRDFVTGVVDHFPNEETKLMNDFELPPTTDKPIVVDFLADDRFWMRIDPDDYYRHRRHHHHDHDFVTGVDFPNKETEPMHGFERSSIVGKPIGVASHADDRLPMWIDNFDGNFRHHHHHRDFVRGADDYFRNQETKPMHDLELPSITGKPMNSDFPDHHSRLPTSIDGNGYYRHHHDCHHHPHHHRVFVQGAEDYFRNEETKPMHDLERPSIAGKLMDASFPRTDGLLPTWMDGFRHPHDHRRYEHPHRLKLNRFEKPKRKYHQHRDDRDDFEDEDDNQKKGGGFFQWIGDLFHFD